MGRGSMGKVLRPYKMIFRGEDEWRGTVSTTNIDNAMSTMHDWKISELTLITNTFDAEQLNELVRTKDHLTMIFAEELPIMMFKSSIFKGLWQYKHFPS